MSAVATGGEKIKNQYCMRNSSLVIIKYTHTHGLKITMAIYTIGF